MSLRIAVASGSPRAVGLACGEAMADEIGDAVEFYRAVGRATGCDFDAVAAATRPYLDAARAAVPDLVVEMEGIADGAGAAREEIALLNCFEEAWCTARTPEACTTMLSGPFLLHAEQWYAGHRGVGIVVATPDEGPPFVSPTCAGFLPAVGLNASGFAQGVDSLTASDDAVGVPRAFVARRALAAGDLDSAVTAARMPGRAGGYAHVLASIARRVVVETGARDAAVLEGVATHTNHYLAPMASARRPSPGSAARLARAEELLATRAPTTLDGCAELLSDHHGSPQTICLHEDGVEAEATVFGMACDLSSGRLIVSDGPPCSGRWTELGVPCYIAPTHVV